MKLIASTILLLSLFSCAFAQEARKIDEFGNISCDELLTKRDGFLNELNASPDLSGYMLIYVGKLKQYNDKRKKEYYVLPHSRDAKEFIFALRKVFSFRNFPLDRIVFVNAGFRGNFTIEFWTVPDGVTPPKPTPTLTKMKYRKGKPRIFCGEF
ncbi:MAG: hypothetical protein AAB336_14190 [Acidobacteriota bacterium]